MPDLPIKQAIVIRDANPADTEAIVALNAAEVQHTSDMDAARLQHLDGLACYHKVAVADGRVVAFLLAMGEGANYANDNFSWFAARYDRFMYIDRIVVSADVKGVKLGTRLYDDLMVYAHANKIATIACEYNVVPPNPASQRFHEGIGFTEVGTQWLHDGAKCVSLQVLTLV